MYVAPPPQSSVGSRQGRMDETPVTKRVYQIWRGSNKFFLGGRLIFGPDVRSLAMTLFLIVVPVTVFCSLVASELVNKFPHHLGIFIMAIAIIFTIYDLFLLLLTSARDPGIIPRNAHPPEPEYETGIPGWGDDGTSRYKLPRTTDVVVNGVTVKSKYCDTCMLYRPPRCSHCSICNNCVERFDHHCPWVGQCIGQRNYRYFFMFVFSTTILCIYVFSFCWVLIRKIMEEQQISVGKAMLKTPASIVLIAYTFIAVWFVGGLTSFHTYLISTNQTTYENFRYRYDRNMNPFNKGVPQNFKEIFFTKMPPSKNNFRAKVQQDTTGFGVVSPSIHEDSFNAKMGKGGSDLEMGIKPSWSTVEIGASEDSQVQNAEGIDTRSVMQSRRSSWGRKSGSWEITPDILALAAGVGAEGNRAATKNSPGNND